MFAEWLTGGASKTLLVAVKLPAVGHASYCLQTAGEEQKPFQHVWPGVPHVTCSLLVREALQHPPRSSQTSPKELVRHAASHEDR